MEFAKFLLIYGIDTQKKSLVLAMGKLRIQWIIKDILETLHISDNCKLKCQWV